MPRPTTTTATMAVAALAIGLAVGGGGASVASGLAMNSVRSPQIANGAIKGKDISRGAVTSATVRDRAVDRCAAMAGLARHGTGGAQGTVSTSQVPSLADRDQVLVLTHSSDTRVLSGKPFSLTVFC
jgi:hypothetical protein